MSLLTNTVATVASGQDMSASSMTAVNLRMKGALIFKRKSVLLGTKAGLESKLGENNILIGNNAQVDPNIVGENCIALGNNCVVPSSNTIAIARDPTNGSNYVCLILGFAQGGYYGSPPNIVPGPFDTEQDAADAGVPLGGLYFYSTDPSYLCIRLT